MMHTNWFAEASFGLEEKETGDCEMEADESIGIKGGICTYIEIILH